MIVPVEQLTPKFVEFIPKYLEPGVIYVSGEYTTTAHQCACGCGEKVVLPLHPTDWQLSFDGKSITMRPSVGNWSFPCRSHYLITNNRIAWANDWSEGQIRAGRKGAQLGKSNWYHQTSNSSNEEVGSKIGQRKQGWFATLKLFVCKVFGY